MALTKRRQAFVDQYFLNNLNGGKAAIAAGYSARSAYSIASELLKDAQVAEAIERRLAELTMSANEVLIRLTDHARGDMSHFVDVNGKLNIKIAGEAGQLKLVKKLRHKSRRTADGIETETEIELYDAQAALVTLGKHHRLFDRQAESDWRQEVMAAGLNPDELEQSLVEEFTRHLAGGATENHRVGLGESASSGGDPATE
jgi:phage terminase small subunit